MYKCPNCGNTDEKYIGYKFGVPYCRMCISFSGEKVSLDSITPNIELSLNYSLSFEQDEISKQVLDAYMNKRDVLINAVTGAGKTELVYRVILHVLTNGGHVGFATPRKDVVIDLTPRIAASFPKARVVSVYGDHTSILKGDIIVLTTHQLYRYPQEFDLLIVDEIDAFPYANNALLKNFMLKSVKGNKVLLSATPSEADIQEMIKNNGVILSLNKRYHGASLPLPSFQKYKVNKYLYCLDRAKKLLDKDHQLFIFVPTIEIGKKLFMMAKLLKLDFQLVYSYEKHRDQKIEDFKKGKIRCLITTTILERGVTVKNLQVIVFESDHKLFSPSSLIQIAGRVGRKIGATKGQILLLGVYENESIKETIHTIENTNRKAMLLNMS